MLLAERHSLLQSKEIAQPWSGKCQNRGAVVVGCQLRKQTALRSCDACAAGAHRPLGLDGWRVAFASLAAAAAVAGAANLALAADPLRPAGGAQPPPKLARVEVAALPPVRHGSGSRKHGSAAVAAPAGPDEELELLALLQRQGAGLGGGDSRSTEAPADGHLEGPADGPSSGGVSQLDPPEHRAPPPPAQPRLDLRGLAADVASVLRIPTFLIIVLQAGGRLGVLPSFEAVRLLGPPLCKQVACQVSAPPSLYAAALLCCCQRPLQPPLALIPAGRPRCAVPRPHPLLSAPSRKAACST